MRAFVPFWTAEIAGLATRLRAASLQPEPYGHSVSVLMPHSCAQLAENEVPQSVEAPALLAGQVGEHHLAVPEPSVADDAGDRTAEPSVVRSGLFGDEDRVVHRLIVPCMIPSSSADVSSISPGEEFAAGRSRQLPGRR